MKLELKIDISRRTILFITLFLSAILIASATSFSSNQLLINQTTGILFGNTSINTTTIVTDFLHGNGSNITSVPATQLTGTAPLAAIPATLTGKDADTVDGYHLNQGVRTTDSPTFVSVNSSYYNTSDGRELQNGGCDASYCIGYNLTNSSITEAVSGSTGKADYSGTNAKTVFWDTFNASTGRVVVKNGSYNLTSWFDMDDNDWLDCEGNATVLSAGADVSGMIRNKAYTAGSGNNYNVKISNCRIISNDYTITNGLIRLDNTPSTAERNRTSFIIENVEIEIHKGTGIAIFDSYNFRVINSNIYGSRPYGTAWNGIHVQGSEDGIVSGNFVSNTSNDGIDIINSQNITASENSAWNNRNAGVWIFNDNATTPSKNNKILNNFAWSNLRGVGQEGNSTDNEFRGNTLSSNTDGIKLLHVNAETDRNTTIDSNKIIDNIDSGVNISTNGSLTITNNIIMRNGGKGIDFNGRTNNSATANDISGNRIMYNGGAAMFLKWFNNSQIYNNLIYPNGQNGIALRMSSDNTIYQNRIIDTTYLNNGLLLDNQASNPDNTNNSISLNIIVGKAKGVLEDDTAQDRNKYYLNEIVDNTANTILGTNNIVFQRNATCIVSNYGGDHCV